MTDDPADREAGFDPGDRDRADDDGLPVDRRTFLGIGGVAAAWRLGTGDGSLLDMGERRDASPTGEGDEPTGAAGLGESLPPAGKVSLRGAMDESRREGGSPGPGTSLVETARSRALPVPLSAREVLTPQWQPKAKPIEQGTWTNWTNGYRARNAAKHRTPDRESLIKQVSEHAEDSYRGVGSGHSHSEAAVPDENYTDVTSITGDLGLNWLKPPGSDVWGDDGVTRDHLIRVGAGTQLKRLNREILPPKGLGLPNMGSWDGQTVAGAVNTSTHGTGYDLGTFSDLVRSVEIVTVPESPVEPRGPVVRMFRIEPEEGITDPDAFARDADRHRMELVQDDDLFHAVVAGYGCVGVVYAYTLEVRDYYWLKEENDFVRRTEFDPYQEAKQHRHYSYLVNLVEAQGPDTNYNPLCFVRKRNPTDKPVDHEVGVDDPPERSETTRMVEKVWRDLPDITEEADVLDALNPFDNPRTVLENDPTSIVDPGQTFRDLATQPPFENQSHRSVYHVALRRRAARRPDDPDREPVAPPMALTTEIGVRAEYVEDAVDDVIEYVGERSDAFFPAPLGVRFTAPSAHAFSPEYRDDPADDDTDHVAMLELPVPVPESIRAEVLPDWSSAMQHFTDITLARRELEGLQDFLVSVDRYGARPHMGKHNTVGVDADVPALRPQNMYPRYDDWLGAVDYFNRFGTFDNEFTENKAGR